MEIGLRVFDVFLEELVILYYVFRVADYLIIHFIRTWLKLTGRIIHFILSFALSWASPYHELCLIMEVVLADFYSEINKNFCIE